MVLILALVALMSWVPGAFCQTVGIYADSLGTEPELWIPHPGPAVTVFVVANPQGIQHDGITAATFRISGIPDGWGVEATPSAAAGGAVTVATGDVFDNGVVMVWSTCIIDPVVLMRVELTPATSVQNAAIQLEAHREEAGSCFISECGPCVTFCGCDGIPKCYCPETAPACINGECTVVVRAASWSLVKTVFK